MTQNASEITRGTRWIYSGGGAGYGALYNAHFFVLIYYSQVLGLEPGLAGLAMSVGLVFDAIKGATYTFPHLLVCEAHSSVPRSSLPHGHHPSHSSWVP